MGFLSGKQEDNLMDIFEGEEDWLTTCLYQLHHGSPQSLMEASWCGCVALVSLIVVE